VKVLFLFVDGVGIGKKDGNNPYFQNELPNIKKLLGGEMPSLRNQKINSEYATLIPADAKLGVAGLPQSGTGQTAIFCGINAPQIIGKHFGPYPYSKLRPYIQDLNIFKKLKDNNKTAHFANAYPEKFFEYIATGTTHFTVTSLACMMSGTPLQKYEDLVEKRAISADITAEGWEKFGHKYGPENPLEVGKTLYNISLDHDFTLFEYYLTDHAGHSMDKQFAKKILSNFDELIGGLMENYDPEKLFTIITSDHGNSEDLSIKTHTFNPVPVILIGKGREKYAEEIKSIMDIYNIILKILV
jgi:2,3-bisphosphoglycerate-independent phosphoglycerate mutase